MAPHPLRSFLALCLAVSGQGWAQADSQITESGLPFLRNFSPHDYGGHSQNWAMVQDGRGVLYVANNDGVFEYDGTRWRLIPMPHRTAVRSLAVDPTGRVYVGTKGDLGYLRPETSGDTVFVSLLTELDPQNREFSDVWKICCTSSGVYFTTSNALFRLNQGRFQVWKPATSFSLAFSVADRFFIRQRDIGIQELAQDQLHTIAGGERFSEFGPAFMLESSKGILIGTQRNGLFLATAEGITPFHTDCEALLRTASPSHALRLPDHTLAIATLQAGILILSSEGQLIRRIDKQCGLQENAIKAMLLDEGSGLWLALNRGLTRVQWPSPLTRFGEANGLEGTVVALCRHASSLYVGTNQGLFQMEPGSDHHAPCFRHVPSRLDNLASACWDLLDLDGHLLVATDRGVCEIHASNPRLVLPTSSPCIRLYRSKANAQRVLVGLCRGLASMRLQQGHWVSEGLIPELTDEIRTIQEDTRGRIWLGTSTSGVIRIDTTWPSHAQAGQLRVKRFGLAEGLPSLVGNNVQGQGDEILISTQKGAFRFDPVHDRFQADGPLQGLLGGVSLRRFDITEAGSGRRWIHTYSGDSSSTRTGLATLDPRGSWAWNASALARMDGVINNAILPEPNGITWFGGPEGIFRLDEHLSIDTSIHHPILVRRVTHRGGAPIPTASTSALPPLQIRHQDNTLRFEFSAPGVEPESAIQYQVLLEGYDHDWSPWAADAYKEYTNLPAGTFRFRVRARNLYGGVRESEPYAFRVLPPWYLTWWAWLTYAVLLAAQTYGWLRWRLWKLAAEKRLLERKVQERTQELAESNAKLQDAQEHIARLMESPANLLEDIPSWVSVVARDIQSAVGARSLGVYELQNGMMKPLREGDTLPPQELAQCLDPNLAHSTFEDNLLFPVRGLSGSLLGMVVAQGVRMERLGPERQLLSGFANQLGNALEMLQVRRKLVVAEAQRASSIQELHARGIETLKICPRCGLCFGHTSTHCTQDLEPLESPELLPLRILERYRFVRRLGSGGMGTVFQAFDEHLGRDVAVKLMRAELFHNAKARLRFEREARSVVQVNHPGVVTVFDSGEVGNGTLYLVMELLRGMSLGSAIRRFGPASSAQVARILRQGSEALEAAHRARIIHRDIKPQNIFLVPSLESFQLKIVDFGLAKSMDDDVQVTQTGLLLGTPGYLAPEVILGQNANEQSDYFAFASVAYEALLGWSLVQGQTLSEVIQALLNNEPVAPTELAPWLPKEVDALFKTMLAKRPEARPASIQSWAHELAQILETHPGPGDGWPDPLPLQDEIHSENATGQASHLRAEGETSETQALKSSLLKPQ